MISVFNIFLSILLNMSWKFETFLVFGFFLFVLFFFNLARKSVLIH